MMEHLDKGWRKTQAELNRLAENARRRRIKLKHSAAVDGGPVEIPTKGVNITPKAGNDKSKS